MSPSDSRYPRAAAKVYAGQSVGVDDDLTAAENLALGGALHGVARDESRRRAAELHAPDSVTDAQDGDRGSH